MKTRLHCEVAIVGGGPAGALAALSLARLGRNVTLFEALPFPRSHVGICMNAGAAQILSTCGLGALLENAAHQKIESMERAWESPCFERVARQDLICDRGELDKDLLAAAAAAGATVLQPYRVGARMKTSEGWSLQAKGPPGDIEVETRVLIDAGGRRSAHERRRLTRATLALFSSWTGSAGSVRLAAAQRSWVWAAPNAQGETNVLTILDPSDMRRRGIDAISAHQRIVQESCILRPGQALAGPVRAMDATPFEALRVSDNSLRIGEAALGLDPLSSSGLSAAMQSAIAGAAAVQTFLDRDGDHEAAIEFVTASHVRRRTQHLRYTAEAYASVATRFAEAFWIDRAFMASTSGGETVLGSAPLPPTDAWLALADQVRITPTACVTGNKIERLAAVHSGDGADPVAFVDGVEIGPLFARMNATVRASDLLVSWARSIGPNSALKLLAWAWKNKVLVRRPT